MTLDLLWVLVIIDKSLVHYLVVVNHVEKKEKGEKVYIYIYGGCYEFSTSLRTHAMKYAYDM